MTTPDVTDTPAELNPRIDWRELAICSGKTELFFARKAERPEARARRELKAGRLCAACPVQLPCRDYARQEHLYGFWGGESEDERHRAGYSLSAPIGIPRGLDTHAEPAAS